MKFSTAACLSALVVPGLSASIGISNARHHFIAADNGSSKVPGDSAMVFCDADRDDDLIQIQTLSTDPNPVKAGKKLTVTGKFEVKTTITKGAYVKLTVKYGLIQLISTTADLCEQIGNVNISCPLEAGKHELSFNVDLPSAIPPGTYNVVGDAYSNDDEKISCLKASVNFPRPAVFGVEL